ncbi:hypothetical protein BFD11_25470 [Escherichia coli]|nr:hypothetical protein BFD11_25470 [Escherichia coli]
MTQTLNPVITVTVSGPVGSGKSYVLARIEEVVKQEFGNSVIVLRTVFPVPGCSGPGIRDVQDKR